MSINEILFWTGVGSRNAPLHILSLAHDIGYKMTWLGHVLRSGKAPGMDTAFEDGARKAIAEGAEGRMELFVANQATPDAMKIAQYFHPAWHRCSTFAKKLHGRNSFQVLGIGLNRPSDGLLCWTPDGCMSGEDRTMRTGGTGTAISIATYYNVPIANLKRGDMYHKWRTWADEPCERQSNNPGGGRAI